MENQEQAAAKKMESQRDVRFNADWHQLLSLSLTSSVES